MDVCLHNFNRLRTYSLHFFLTKLHFLRTDYDAYKTKIAELELNIKQQKEELDSQHQQTVIDLQHQFDNDKTQLEEKHRIEILGYENMLAQVSSL